MAIIPYRHNPINVFKENHIKYSHDKPKYIYVCIILQFCNRIVSLFYLMSLLQRCHHNQLHQLFNQFLLWLCGLLLSWVYVPQAQRGS